MLTDGKKRRGRKLSHEILGLLAVALVITLFLFQLLSVCATALTESYLAAQETALTEDTLLRLDSWIFNLSLLVSVCFFTVLFLFLLGERLSYIREIVKGINALQNGQQDYVIPLEGRNELTRLAQSVNTLSLTRREISRRERALNEEKEQLIRSLSHDIRTPLTSILSYSEYLSAHEDLSPEQRRTQLDLICHKAKQIGELTDVLLSGGARQVERFDDAQLLMEQLAASFEDELEAEFPLSVELDCAPFAASLDAGELRRIFDNLISNIRKYADSTRPVTLRLTAREGEVIIRQENTVRPAAPQSESYRMGLRSIQRIAHNYAGTAVVEQDGDLFIITVTLSDL